MVMCRKFNFLMKHCLMCCPLNTNVQVSKIIIINLNFN